jgi:hypothetical protein
MAGILSNRSAALWGLGTAQMGAAYDIGLDQAYLRHPKEYPFAPGIIDGYEHLFREYDLVNEKKEKSIPINAETPNDVARMLGSMPQSERDLPTGFLQHGRRFLLDFASLAEYSTRTIEAWSNEDHPGKRNPLPMMYGISYYPPASPDKVVFTPVSPTTVLIRTKDPKGYIDSGGDKSVWTKSLRAVKEDGKWYIDFDPNEL